MTEYWVSKKSYFCKYCDIYIRDDKPSRAQHENGLRHKGNLERYIREIYKKEDRAQKERADEASQIAKINEAARIAHAQSDLPQAGPSVSKRVVDDEEEGKSDEAEYSKRLKRATEDWKGAEDVNNYSDARSLGLISAEDEEASFAEAEKQARLEEGLIGKWEAVRKLPPVLKPCTVTERSAPAAEKMAIKLAAERDPEKAPIRKMFSERKLETDLDPLEGMEVKVKVDRRSQARLKREAEEAEAEARAASRVIHGSLRPIRLDGLTSDDDLDDPATDPQPSALPPSSYAESEDIKPKLEPFDTPATDPTTSAQPSVTFKKRKNLKSQPRQKI